MAKRMARFAKERDLECRIELSRVFGSEYVEVYDYVPSEDQRLSGFVINTQHLDRLIEELTDIRRLISPSSVTVQCEGQGVLQ